MAKATTLTVNGIKSNVTAAPKTALLYVLRNDLDQHSPRFGCGLAQCGACTVQVDGQVVRACVTPLSTVAGKRITTLESLAANYAAKHKKPAGTLHPVQAAFIEHQAVQCGYCINGWILTAAAFLDAKPGATEAEIRVALAGLKCRCGTHMSILRAVKSAAAEMTKAAS